MTGLSGEVMEGHLPRETVINYETPPKPGQEHHLIVLDGELALTVDGVRHALSGGDCLRYHLSGPTQFETGAKRGRMGYLKIDVGKIIKNHLQGRSSRGF